MANEIVVEYEVSITRACRLMEIYRSYYYYVEKQDDEEVENAIRCAAEYGNGFWKIYKSCERKVTNGITRKFTVCTSQCIMKKEGH